jgi:hypothetical protein
LLVPSNAGILTYKALLFKAQATRTPFYVYKTCKKKIAISINFGTKAKRKSQESQKHGCFAYFSVLLTTSEVFAMMNLVLSVNK